MCSICPQSPCNVFLHFRSLNRFVIGYSFAGVCADDSNDIFGQRPACACLLSQVHFYLLSVPGHISYCSPSVQICSHCMDHIFPLLLAGLVLSADILGINLVPQCPTLPFGSHYRVIVVRFHFAKASCLGGYPSQRLEIVTRRFFPTPAPVPRRWEVTRDGFEDGLTSRATYQVWLSRHCRLVR